MINQRILDSIEEIEQISNKLLQTKEKIDELLLKYKEREGDEDETL